MANDILDENLWKELAYNKAIEHGFDSEDLAASKVAGYQLSLNLETFKQSLIMNAMGVKERFVSTADKMDSIVKAAADRNMDVGKATPAYARVLLVMNIQSMKTYFESEELTGKDRIVKFNKENPISIDGTPFSLYYDLEVYMDDNDKIHVYYTSEHGYVNPLDSSNILTKPISTVETTIGSSTKPEAIGIVLDVRQYIRESAQARYIQNIKVEIHTISFTNQFVDFSAKYTSSDYSKVSRYLGRKQSFAKEEVNEECIFYRLSSSNTIQLFNRLNGNFIPETNSLLDIEILTTLGTKGSFIYTGSNITTTFPSGIIENSILILNQPAGGKDTPTLKEARDEVIKMSATRNTISNEEDLKKHYQENLGIYMIDKLRHDFFSLTYGVVAALKNTDHNFYYATNTLNLLFYPLESDYMDDDHLLVDPIEIISYEHGEGVNYNATEADVLSYHYRLPYVMIYNKTTNTISVYEKTYDREYLVSKKDVIASSPFSMIMNKFKITKNSASQPLIEGYITTTRDISNDGDTNDDVSPILGTVDGNNLFVDDGTVLMRAVFYNQGLFIGYKDCDITEFNNDDKYYKFQLNEFASAYPYDNKVPLFLKDRNGEDIEALTPINNIFVEFEIYVRNETIGVINSPDYGYIDLENEYTRLNKYISDELFVYKNISHFNNIICTAKDGAYYFHNVPVVGFDAYTMYPKVIDEKIRTEISKLETIHSLIPQNHQLCLRFANTYGFSKRYKVGYNLDLDLDQLYLGLKWIVKIAKGTTIDKIEVARFINSEIMKIDFTNGDFLHMGNIITALKNKYTQITFVEFAGMNDLPSVYQYISLATSDTLVDSTPEILSVEHLLDDDYGFIPNIAITIVETT